MPICFRILAFSSATIAGANEITDNKCNGEQDEFRRCNVGNCESDECVDCTWGEWSDYTPCTCEGLMDRHRSVATKNNGCGKPCSGPKVTTKSCMPDCVDKRRDCTMTPWSSWEQCDKTCEGGQRSRSRRIAHNLENNGFGCTGSLQDTESCNNIPCHSKFTCVLSEWSSWDDCSKTCDAGQQTRSRRVTSPPEFGGKPCDASLIEVRPCPDIEPCLEVTACQWGEWGEWSACSQTCGAGDKSRSRQILVAPRNGGELCDARDLSEVVGCNKQACEVPVDCLFGEWTEWDACSCTCNGIQHRLRHIDTYAEDNGAPCIGALREIQSCNHDQCTNASNDSEEGKPVDGKLGEWGEWAACSATCGKGSRRRARTVIQVPKLGGKPCSGELETLEPCMVEECTEPSCDSDCVWGDWEEWDVCSASCDGGEKVRHRQIKKMAAGPRGKPCADQASMEVAECNTNKCGCEECRWSTWSSWGACSCTGLMERHRAVDTRYHACGTPCVGSKVETASCSPHCVGRVVHCELSDWSAWTRCSAECGGGQMKRMRNVMKTSSNGGDPCVGSLIEALPCGLDRCHAPDDCVTGEWEAWSKCSKSCNGGQKFRARVIKVHPSFNGLGCNATLSEVSDCNNESCEKVHDCEWDEWGEWGACSEPCSGGQKSRSRSIKVAPLNGGRLCAPVPRSEMVPCNVQHCNAHCHDARWENWSAWSLCSATCGSSYQFRSRNLMASASSCGKSASGLSQDFRPCDDVPCNSDAVDCEFSPWGKWSACSCTCNGMRERERYISLFPQGGLTCDGSLKEIEPCGETCDLGKPVDCKLSEWAPWGTCSAKCGGGVFHRQRHVDVPSRYRGAPCSGDLEEVGACNEEPCSHQIDCEWGEWNEWGSCSMDCGGGQRQRYRHILTMCKHGGKECDAGASAELQECNKQACGVDSFCVWAPWASWGSCSASCGDGQQKRDRHLQLTREKPEEETVNEVLMTQNRVHFTKNEQVGIVFLTGALFSSLVSMVFTRHRRRSSFQLIDNPAD